MLEWPIFGYRYDRTSLDAALFEGLPCRDTDSDEDVDIQTLRRTKKPGRGIRQEETPSLVHAFLENVHIKNPVLDATDLKKWAEEITERGFGWSAKSCLLLVACGLGVLSSPFGTTRVAASDGTSLSETEDYTTAETYYNESRKRTGLLSISLLSAQCFFLSGVYEMYSMRPLQAWAYRFGTADPTTPKPSSTVSLEHRMYWSCLKSISEIREQLQLPPSGLASFDYPLFPTLPATASESLDPPLDTIYEKSWFYYLAEISSRRISNRILNAFYKHDNKSWLSANVESMVRMGHELESQVEQWSEHIPLPVGFTEADVPQEELAFFTRAREVHMSIFLYRPFLFLVIHGPDSVRRDPRVQLLADKCLRRCFQFSSSIGIKHRHHGAYFSGRNLLAIGLTILASVKSGRVRMPPVGEWESHLDHIFAYLKYWDDETPDFGRAKAILTDIWKEVVDVHA
ncbi:hypothetical protein MPH_12586 [Macrophomina phaseolina MS6]|uniref:Transcription factor fungi n=1 Tax=Macrophomina phaseolina (strain MS6) TaxID=1126212 RepID=K2QKC6_MACPH|nr:hypothetical protein MPH_12586 [Macrophomina phaseolina MS6]